MSDSTANRSAEPPAEDLEDLYENAPCGYLSIRTDGRIFKVNTTLSKWLGFSPEELLGKRFQDLLNIAGRIFYETHFAPLLRIQGFFNEVALDLVTRDAKRLPVLVNATERRDPEGRHLFTRITVFNATDRRRYERDLVEARAAADAANKQLQELNARAQASLLDERATAALREQFIAVLGHDLRNPLTAIHAALELLATRQTDPRDQRLIAMADRSAARMSALIDQVMDFARGRLGGGLPLNLMTPTPLQPVLEQVVAELQANAPDRAIEADYALPDPVTCDPERIAQLCSNLLANALTHGAPDAPVRLGAATREESFELWVANGGEPIPPAVQEQLFHPFFRGAARASRQGLGLGLYIASEIARAHRGLIEVSSSTQETRFTFRMPLHP